jgi:hypothetical protein
MAQRVAHHLADSKSPLVVPKEVHRRAPRLTCRG